MKNIIDKLKSKEGLEVSPFIVLIFVVTLLVSVLFIFIKLMNM
tara:strand:+ start:18101 stop:18229 length:129 start_codon:yes stop_codon:yes gene_type:complete